MWKDSRPAQQLLRSIAEAATCACKHLMHWKRDMIPKFPFQCTLAGLAAVLPPLWSSLFLSIEEAARAVLPVVALLQTFGVHGGVFRDRGAVQRARRFCFCPPRQWWSDLRLATGRSPGSESSLVLRRMGLTVVVAVSRRGFSSRGWFGAGAARARAVGLFFVRGLSGLPFFWRC
ncbi:anhydro-N-acetylmuramic acid kinase [Striga asiatica]|uniref:Anhydro-N-acetylmuramic acid kinase n=1 Tax=Striga asiatica TaxID=4170 RepID=A0A5A7PPV9_STRAF|nr:anhydro-N-acetylmuramic acid kinase [Striga asiatica]